MSDIIACCVCLVKNVKLYNMTTYDIKNVYEMITGVEVFNIYQLLTCSYCGLMMKKFQEFSKKCINSHNYLTKTLYRSSSSNNKTKYTPYKKTKTTTTDIVFSQDVRRETVVLERLELDTDESEKEDGRSTITFQSENFINDDSDSCLSSDSEMSYVEDIANDVEVIILTKDQQRQELLDSKESYNYRSSMYKCEKCYKGFLTENTFSNHMVRHDPQISGPMVCNICLLCWPNKRSLKKHIAISHAHHYICRVCAKVTRTSSAAREHSNSHSGVVYSCKRCDMKFGDKSTYVSHVRTQHPSKHFCDLCGDSFVSEMGLIMHRKKGHKDIVQTPPSDFACSQCDVVFQNYTAMTRHHDVTGYGNCREDTMSSCVKCGNSFPSVEMLYEHLKSHNPEPKAQPAASPQVHITLPHQCSICLKDFRRKESLNRHIRVHTGEKPFKCTVCNRAFTQASSMKTHVKVVHMRLRAPNVKLL